MIKLNLRSKRETECPKRLGRLIAACFLGTLSLSASAQPTNAWPPYKALYCFGFSWTDTQGLYMNNGPDFVNGNADYWQNRACNGPVWPEFLSTNLGLTYTTPNNLARGAAVTADTLTQIDWLGTLSDPAHNLYVVWVAAGDFVNYAGTTSDRTWNIVITNVLGTSSNIVQGLYSKGARSVVVQNCLDLSLAPKYIRQFGAGANALQMLKQYAGLFNSRLQEMASHIQDSYPDLRICVVDIFTHENEVYTNAAASGFSKVFPDALSDNQKSFTGAGADYMFWDDLHGTSKFQELVAKWTGEALTNSAPEKTEVQLDPNGLSIRMSHLLAGRAYTLEKSQDLSSWWEATSFVAAAGTNQWPDPTPSFPQTFYRLAWRR